MDLQRTMDLYHETTNDIECEGLNAKLLGRKPHSVRDDGVHHLFHPLPFFLRPLPTSCK